MFSFKNTFSFKLKDFNIVLTVIKVNFISTARAGEREQHCLFHILQKYALYFAVPVTGIH